MDSGLPLEVPWSTTLPAKESGKEQQWCFYNVRLPHAELSWIATSQVAAAALDASAAAVFERVLPRVNQPLQQH